MRKKNGDTGDESQRTQSGLGIDSNGVSGDRAGGAALTPEDDPVIRGVKEVYPQAYPTPYPEANAWWIVTGTGFTMGWAKTPAEAWKASLRLLHDGARNEARNMGLMA